MDDRYMGQPQILNSGKGKKPPKTFSQKYLRDIIYGFLFVVILVMSIVAISRSFGSSETALIDEQYTDTQNLVLKASKSVTISSDEINITPKDLNVTTSEDVNMNITQDLSANVDGQIKLISDYNSQSAIHLETTAGGMNLLASGAAAGEDINVTASGSSINIKSTENAEKAIYLQATTDSASAVGTSQTIRIENTKGTSVSSDGSTAALELEATVGGIYAHSGLNAANAIYHHVDGGPASTLHLHNETGNTKSSIYLNSDEGGISLDCNGTGGNAAIYLQSTNGVKVTSGTNLLIEDDNGELHIGASADLKLYHGGTNSVVKHTTATGNLILNNEAAAGHVIAQTGADTSAASFKVQNNSGNDLFTVDGSGDATLTAGDLIITSATNGIVHTNSGTVTQATDHATSVTLNTTSGVITLAAVALGSHAEAEFTFTNSTIKEDSVILLTVQDQNTTATGHILATTNTITNGYCIINLFNTGGDATSATASKIHFIIINKS